jgi:hypothetical protein
MKTSGLQENGGAVHGHLRRAAPRRAAPRLPLE